MIVAFTVKGEARLAWGYLRPDATARLFLVVIDVIFLGIAAYVWNRWRSEPTLRGVVSQFTWLSLAFMVAANVVVLSNHLIVGWIALETTTLLAAPLRRRPGVPSSWRASWRYFPIVGGARAGAPRLRVPRAQPRDQRARTDVLHRRFVHAREAGRRTCGAASASRSSSSGTGPSSGSRRCTAGCPRRTTRLRPRSPRSPLAAVQFNCALLCLIRVLQVYRSGNRELVATELLAIGLASMAVSTVSIIATRNVKRLVAYASINHAGVIAIGLAIGKSAAYGVLLYVVSNAFIKAILFLTVGKIRRTTARRTRARSPGSSRTCRAAGSS